MQERHPFPEDWSAHRLQPSESKSLIYMADAAALAASILTFPWEPYDRLEPAGWKPVPSLVAPDVAFDEDLKPVAEWHELQGGFVRSFVSTGSYGDHRDGLPDVPIDYDNWDEAWWTSTMINSSRETCREIAVLVADVITTAATAGTVVGYVRPMGGGAPPIPAPEYAWSIDDPVARLASCALKYDRPGDTTAVPDHLVFLQREGFEDAIREFVPSRWRALVPELSGMSPPGRPSVTQRRNMLVKAMVKAIEGDKDKRWTRRALVAAVTDARLHDYTPNMLEEARLAAIKQTGIEPGPGRPTVLELQRPFRRVSAETSG